jgi:signal transduction protein with GAF and PtsI domain
MLFLIDEETSELYLRVAKGVGDKRASTVLLPARDSLIGQVVKTGEPLRIASSDPRLDLTVKTGYMVNSLLYVPLKLKAESKGVLAVSNRISDRAFSRTDQSRLDLLADHIVIALECARLREGTPGQVSHEAEDTVGELARYAYQSLKSFAADTYALKASVERGLVSAGDDTLTRLLDSMERGIEQMASVTEILNRLSSPGSTDEDREELQQRFQKIKGKYVS